MKKYDECKSFYNINAITNIILYKYNNELYNKI